MATTELGSQRRYEGADLIAALRDVGIEMDAAFWLFDVSLEEWRLVLVTPQIETKGPKQLHSDVYGALKRAPHLKMLTLYDIDLQSPYSATVALLASKVPFNSSIPDVNLHSSLIYINDIIFDEHHIHHIASYFMNKKRYFT